MASIPLRNSLTIQKQGTRLDFSVLKRGLAVKGSRFTKEQIALALKQAELGSKVQEICRSLGVSDATFYRWRQQYGPAQSPLRRLRALEKENAKLNRLVGDLSRDNALLRDALLKLL
jgi:putative transposase